MFLVIVIVKGLIIQSKSGIQIYPKTGRGGPENNGQKIYNFQVYHLYTSSIWEGGSENPTHGCRHFKAIVGGW